jgi:predicted regulator of Ras-like GTPase activity (Roadblock/LC7/MglB family)
MPRKNSVNETMQIEEIAVIEIEDSKDDITPSTELQDSPDYAKLLEAVQEIRKRTDVVGFILRNDSKATADLDDSSKIIEYAMLSSQSFETSKAIAGVFNLGETENIFIEGKNLNVLSLVMGQNKISLFLQKSVEHESILKVLCHN